MMLRAVIANREILVAFDIVEASFVNLLATLES